jgi:prepilin-type N-terminal cleavage/methylation domain-containing protein
MPRRHNRGFTLVELLVVIAIISLLMGLLLVGIGAAQRTARRTQCLNNVKQLVTAINLYENAKGRYPGYREIVGRDPVNPAIFKNASWTVSILRFMDQEPVWESWRDPSVALTDLITPSLGVMTCPEDPTSDGAVGAVNSKGDFVQVFTNEPPYTSYAVNAGYLPRTVDLQMNTFGRATFDYPNLLIWAQRKANGVFHDLASLPNARVTSTDLKDGLGNTILVSENLQAIYWHATGLLNEPARLNNTFGWLFATAKPKFQIDNLPASVLSGLPNNPAYGNSLDIPPVAFINGGDENTPTATLSARPSSAHSGVVIVGFADGSTKALSDGIDYTVYQSLLTPNNRKSDMPTRGYILKSEDFNQ